MATSPSTRHKEQAGYVLHTYPYQETSLIVEMFTREFGRVPMVAKGAKRPHSPLRSVLMPFHGLTLDWSGRSDLKTLRSAEWRGAFRLLEHREEHHQTPWGTEQEFVYCLCSKEQAC